MSFMGEEFKPFEIPLIEVPKENMPVAFEAPIGAGKTTTGRGLHEATNYELILEDPEFNAVIEPFYKGLGGDPDHELAVFAMQPYVLGQRSFGTKEAYKRNGVWFFEDRTHPGDKTFYRASEILNKISQKQRDYLYYLNDRQSDIMQKAGIFYGTVIYFVIDPKEATRRQEQRKLMHPDMGWEVVPESYNSMIRDGIEDLVLPDLQRRGVKVVELPWSEPMDESIMWIRNEPVLTHFSPGLLAALDAKIIPRNNRP